MPKSPILQKPMEGPIQGPLWVTVSIWGAVGSVLFRTTVRAASVGDAVAEVMREHGEKLAAVAEPVEMMPRVSVIGQVAGRGMVRPETARSEVGWPCGWQPRSAPVRAEPRLPGMGL
jgi:hypothetical protein